jgi:hypothetical protein
MRCRLNEAKLVNALMRPIRKWMMISVGGGFLITVALLLLKTDLFIDIIVVGYGQLGAITKRLFWPVSAVLYLVGPGPTLGPPEKHMHEWTPVHDIAVAVGIGLSWTFYSGLVFLIVWLRQRRFSNR